MLDHLPESNIGSSINKNNTAGSPQVATKSLNFSDVGGAGYKTPQSFSPARKL